MKVSIKNRIMILMLLPSKDTYANMIIAGNIEDKIKFGSDEVEKIKLSSDEKGNTVWDAKEAEDIEVNFSHSEVGLLKQLLDKLSEQKEVTKDLLPIFALVNS